LQRFKSGALRWLCNVDVLTTGYDAPNIDAIAVLRATQSPGLFAQMCGRGFRLHPGKQNCLILDFGQNIKRHGPLDAADYGMIQAGGRGDGTGEAPVKYCPNCSEPNHTTARECIAGCGFVFPPPKPRHEGQAGDDAILSHQDPPKIWDVEACRACLWVNKQRGTRTMRVDYECRVGGGNLVETISEWVCLEHDGYAGRKAQDWWKARCSLPAPNIDEAVHLWSIGAVKVPRQIETKRDGRWWRIVRYELEEAHNPDGICDELARGPAVATIDDFSFEQESEVPF
jgi:DNA repair protein RadD